MPGTGSCGLNGNAIRLASASNKGATRTSSNTASSRREGGREGGRKGGGVRRGEAVFVHGGQGGAYFAC